ncbi:MAG: succinate dehydrogenase, hydrophobic membrane anchor protein [Salinarimonadaceae bacterium]|nr:MAG: succinate dehydrogenase, hydrophobic membrane anchor protein [Salinarimonadaceae bacterium]
MAEHRFDNGKSMRTPMARAKGLGASGGGTEHFWRQRVSAVANALLVLPVVIIVAMIAGRPQAEAVAIVSHPFAAILLALFVVSIAYHMRLGMQIIIEDYVHGKGAKVAALIANTFFAVLVGAASLFAILKIGFSPLF